MPSYRIVPVNTICTINKPQNNMSCYAACAPRPTRRYHNVTPFGFARASPFGDFATSMQPLFRLLDDELTRAASLSHPIRSFQPRFDVREEGNAYHLQGELPGISQNDISIEFKDEHTLVVSGRAARESKQTSEDLKGKGKATNEPVSDETASTTAEDASDSASETGSNYHKPTVEDEFVDVASETQANETTAAPSATATADVANSAEEPEKVPAKAQDQSRYWVSERSVGQFHRSFTFSGHVDQEAVTASLKNGILNIVVPKAAEKEPRRIHIE